MEVHLVVFHEIGIVNRGATVVVGDEDQLGGRPS